MKSKCRHRRAGDERQSTGLSHLEWFSPSSTTNNKREAKASLLVLVPENGLEPSRGCPQGILSPRCLPFHHSGIACLIIAQLFCAVKPL